MYETFYRLSARPFQLSPDPRFFYGSRTHKRALAYLRYGIEQGEGFIVITGDVGTGKTTLVGRLFQSLDSQRTVAAKIVSTQIQAEDLLRITAAEFGLPYQRVTKAALLRSLEVYFRSCVEEKKRVLLVVDEAQNLPQRAIEELRMLSNFQWNGRPLLQSFLLGQREFRTIMRSEGLEQLRQRVIAAYHLQHLNREETREYIEHRLKLVGWKQDPRISDQAFDDIYNFTQGVPRKTNLLCDRVLLFGALEELHEITSQTMEVVIADVQQELWHPDEPEDLSPKLADGNPNGGTGDTPAIGGGKREEREIHAARDQRLNEVEQSMRALSEAIRDELSQLREAVGKVSKDDTGEKDA